jgi:dCMP deaminase
MAIKWDEVYDRDMKAFNKGDLDLNKFIEIMCSREENQELITDLINLIKTADVCNYTYGQLVNEINERMPLLPPSPEMIVAFTTYYVNANGSNNGKRDVFREAAAYKFNVSEDEVTQEMINKTTAIQKNYSINEPPVESWDEYFYNVCVQTARNSKCLSRRIGVILVRDKRMIAAGYNGPASGIAPCDQRWKLDPIFNEKYKDKIVINNGGDPSFSQLKGVCPRKAIGCKSGENLDMCLAVHAEENAILMCAKAGIKAEGATMYMTCGIPCMLCLNKIIQVGIEELVVTGMNYYDDTSRYLLENSKVKVRLFDFI